MPKADGTGPYWGGGPRSGMQRGWCSNPGLSGLGDGLAKVPWYFWALGALGGLLYLRSYGKERPKWLPKL
jgi:hypothetical protein